MRSSLFCQAHAPRAPAVWAGPEQKRAERSYSAGDVQRGLAAILTALHFNQTDLSAEKASLDCGHPSMARKVSAVPQYDGGHFAVDVRGVANPRSWCRVDDLAGPAGAAVARPDGSLSQMASREGNPCWPVLVAYARVV